MLVKEVVIMPYGNKKEFWVLSAYLDVCRPRELLN
jgi:hypothetical protein